MRLEPIALVDRPELWKLRAVMDLMVESGVSLMATPDRGRIDVVGKLPDWAMTCLGLHFRNLAYWWTHSPCCIAVCDECGEWKITGSRSTTRCVRGQQNKRAKFKWGCQGEMKPLDLPWTSKRPNRKRVKL